MEVGKGPNYICSIKGKKNLHAKHSTSSWIQVIYKLMEITCIREVTVDLLLFTSTWQYHVHFNVIVRIFFLWR
jgi:hypothetical protein